MFRPRVIPCLLLKGSGLVKTIKFKDPKYVGDPINAVKIFNDKGADELIFLDIMATAEKRKPNTKIISEIASEAFMPVGYGGGVTNLDDIREILGIGVEKVIINSYAIECPDFITEASNLVGSQSIVVSIDVKKSFWGNYSVVTDNAKNNVKIDPVTFAQKMAKAGAGELMVNSVDRDGTMAGYDLELIKNVANSVDIPVIACGGARQLEDFGYAVNKANASAVAAGSMFVFHGKHRAVLITYPGEDDLTSLFKN